MYGAPDKPAEEHSFFRQRQQELQEVAGRLADSLAGGSPRPFQLPTALAERDLLDVPALHTPAFDRNAANEQYDQLTQNLSEPGTNAALAALKMQIDSVAAEERALRLRLATPVRCQLAMHARLAGHGQPGGVIARHGDQIRDMISAGTPQ